MKPLHVGLLVVGAAIAGALAVKMTEPPALPQPARSVPVTRPEVVMAPAVAPRSAEPVSAPAAISSSPPNRVASTTLVLPATAKMPAPDTGTSAPPPVYSEPRHVATKPAPFPAVSDSGLAKTADATAMPRPVPYQQPAASNPDPAVIPAPAAEQGQRPSLIQQIEEPHAPRQVTLEPGMTIAARMMETLSSDRVSAGDSFSATLAEPLVVDGLIIAERGSRVDGRVVATTRPARMNGRAEIQLALSRITTADGQRITVTTEPWAKVGASSGTTQAEELGGGAALGAIIGAIAGGGKGAAIGAGIGAGAGAGTAIATRAQPVTVATESVIRFRVNSRVTITERQL